MPEMDGYELARAIRKTEQENGGTRTPIVACTANALAAEAEHCFEVGMDSFLVKPVEIAALAKVLGKWLPLPEAEAENHSFTAALPSPGREDAPVDRSRLAELSGGDAAAERDILIDFRSVNDDDAAMLIQALNARDAALVIRASHRIKGASRMIGAIMLADVCDKIEHAGRANDWDQIAANRDAFDRELERLNAWLRCL